MGLHPGPALSPIRLAFLLPFQREALTVLPLGCQLPGVAEEGLGDPGSERRFWSCPLVAVSTLGSRLPSVAPSL